MIGAGAKVLDELDLDAKEVPRGGRKRRRKNAQELDDKKRRGARAYARRWFHQNKIRLRAGASYRRRTAIARTPSPISAAKGPERTKAPGAAQGHNAVGRRAPDEAQEGDAGKVAEVREITRIERIGAHSHIRGLGTDPSHPRASPRPNYVLLRSG